MLSGGVEIVVDVELGPRSSTAVFATRAAAASSRTRRTPWRAAAAAAAPGKFVLDPDRSAIESFGALSVETARPYYDAILREEMPDAVVGDVFSLDLALPLCSGARIRARRNVRLFWLVHDYSPARVREQLAAHAPEVELIPDGPTGVARALLG